MPSVRCLERQLLCKPECHEDSFAPSLAYHNKKGAEYVLPLEMLDLELPQSAAHVLADLLKRHRRALVAGIGLH